MANGQWTMPQGQSAGMFVNPLAQLATSQPAQAQPQPRRRRRGRKKNRKADIATRLFTDRLITGSGEAAGEGIIPYALMPEQVRKQVPLDAPPIGWDPSKLRPEELNLLKHFLALGERERAGIQGKMGGSAR